MRYFFVAEFNKADLDKIKEKLTIRDLPLHLQEVAEIIGIQSLLKLMQRYRGKKVYIPKKKKNSTLQEFISDENLIKLCEYYGGDYLDFRKSNLRRTLNKFYMADLREEYLKTSCSLDDFITQYNLSKRVRNNLCTLKKNI